MINIDYYLAAMCFDLEAPSLALELNSDIYELRVDYKEFLSPKVADEMIPLASKPREEVGNYIQLGQDIHRRYSSWECGYSKSETFSSVCYGACIGSMEMTRKTARILSSANILSPLIQIELFNPRNGVKLNGNNLKEPITFSIPIELNQNMELLNQTKVRST